MPIDINWLILLVCINWPIGFPMIGAKAQDGEIMKQTSLSRCHWLDAVPRKKLSVTNYILCIKIAANGYELNQIPKGHPTFSECARHTLHYTLHYTLYSTLNRSVAPVGKEDASFQQMMGWFPRQLFYPVDVVLVQFWTAKVPWCRIIRLFNLELLASEVTLVAVYSAFSTTKQHRLLICGIPSRLTDQFVVIDSLVVHGHNIFHRHDLFGLFLRHIFRCCHRQVNTPKASQYRYTRDISAENTTTERNAHGSLEWIVARGLGTSDRMMKSDIREVAELNRHNTATSFPTQVRNDQWITLGLSPCRIILIPHHLISSCPRPSNKYVVKPNDLCSRSFPTRFGNNSQFISRGRICNWLKSSNWTSKCEESSCSPGHQDITLLAFRPFLQGCHLLAPKDLESQETQYMTTYIIVYKKQDSKENRQSTDWSLIISFCPNNNYCSVAMGRYNKTNPTP